MCRSIPANGLSFSDLMLSISSQKWSIMALITILGNTQIMSWKNILGIVLILEIRESPESTKTSAQCSWFRPHQHRERQPVFVYHLHSHRKRLPVFVFLSSLPHPPPSPLKGYIGCKYFQNWHSDQNKYEQPLLEYHARISLKKHKVFRNFMDHTLPM